MAIVWLSSYPRSGNTWLRFLIQAYARGGPVESLRLNAEIPDLHRPGARVDPDSAARVPVKTHYAWSGQHAFADRTAGAVYILRHPKDVLLSFLAYRKLNRVLPPDDPEIDRRYALMFCKGLGDYLWLKGGMGSWVEHFRAWDRPFPHRRVLVRYENLQSAPQRELPPVLELLGLDMDEARLAAAIESCRFSVLREAEEKEKRGRAQGGGPALFEGRPELLERGLRFMNEGRSGRTLAHLGADVEEAFDSAFAPYLEELGYGATAPEAGGEVDDGEGALLQR
ncbi:MAG: sulfotransferase domain-containing protein [Phycisphaerales bacterium]|nr:sulfotransferase domain-containing protein [Phycisphaerales bacterium]